MDLGQLEQVDDPEHRQRDGDHDTNDAADNKLLYSEITPYQSIYHQYDQHDGHDDIGRGVGIQRQREQRRRQSVRPCLFVLTALDEEVQAEQDQKRSGVSVQSPPRADDMPRRDAEQQSADIRGEAIRRLFQQKIQDKHGKHAEQRLRQAVDKETVAE